MNNKNQTHPAGYAPVWLPYLVSLILVLAAAGLRLWPLQELGLRIPYVTFYPAVTIAALYGGLPVGLISTTLSAFVILFWPPKIVSLVAGQPTYRVLIVEDQEENWQLLRCLLEDVGFVVEIAKNGAEGVEKFQRFRPHFIWMDSRMPIMDGLEATQRIRALEGGKAVKIAAVTESAFSDQRDEMLAAGMDDFVRKPYRPQEIFDCMARLLGVRFLYQQGMVQRVESKTDLSPIALVKLTEALRKKLLNALILGNTDWLDALLKRIEQQDADLATMLGSYLHSYNYLPILNALESLDGDSTNTPAT